MRHRLLLSAISLLASLAIAGAAGHTPTSGKYTWAPPRDVVSFYKRHHLPAPTAVLWLNDEKGVFRHILTDDQGSETTLGTFVIEDDKVIFKIESGEGVGLPRNMTLDDSGISAGSTVFLRTWSAKPVPVVVRETPVMRAPSWIVGTWTLRGDSGEDTTTRFSFTPDGCFRYKGLGGTSAGKFEATDSCIELMYTEVDGVPVERGVRMHKSLPVRDSCGCFIVDTYRYEKASSHR